MTLRRRHTEREEVHMVKTLIQANRPGISHAIATGSPAAGYVTA